MLATPNHEVQLEGKTGRRCVSGHLSAVRRRRPHQSAATLPLEGHAPPRRLRLANPPPRAIHTQPLELSGAPPLLGDLLRPHCHVPSLPVCTELRQDLRYLVVHSFFPAEHRWAHIARSAASSRAHWRHGQSSLVHLWPRFFLLSLPLASLLLGVNLYWVAVALARWRTAAQHRRAAILDGEAPSMQ